MSFEQFNLSPALLGALDKAGFKEPTPVQAGAIPPAINGRDVLAIAQTGTGKTGSFVIPLLMRLERGRARARMPRSLILAPTRELATQVAEAVDQLGINHKLTTALLIGGVSFEEQFKKLDRGADILIATPGRLMDHFSRGKLLLTGVEVLIIDEADRMLDMGFISDIEKICKMLPPRRQTMFFSATMPPAIKRFTEQFLKNPEQIQIARENTTAKTITQTFVRCPATPKEKRETLRKLLEQQDIDNAIIFCNRKRDTDILFKSLLKHGYKAGSLHGDMDQPARTRTLEAFKNGEVTILAASDVAARGLDVPSVSHVFNFDIPIHPEDYVHRIGRTGRAGRKGFAFSLVSKHDKKAFDAVVETCELKPTWLEGDGLPDSNEDRGSSNSSRRRSNKPASKKVRGTKGSGSPADDKRTQPQQRNRSEERHTKADHKKPNNKKPRSKSSNEKPRKKTVGMGNHMPAFMKRETQLKRD